MKSKTIGLLGYFGHENVGDEAMLETWVSTLRQLWPDVRIVAYTKQPGSTADRLNVTAPSGPLPRFPMDFVRGLLGRSRAGFRDTLRAFDRSDALVIGGGSLFHDRPDSADHLMALLYTIKRAKHKGQIILILGVSMGPIHRSNSESDLRSVLNLVDGITVRDQESLSFLNKVAVIRPEIALSSDPTNLMPCNAWSDDHSPDLSGERREKAPRIGLCARAVDLRSAHFREAILDVGRHCLGELQARLDLLPFQRGGGEDDYEALQELSRELDAPDQVEVLSPDRTVESWTETIGELDFLIAEKFHAVLFARNSLTPFLGIAYAPKVRRLCEQMGQPDWSLDLEDVRKESLTTRFKELWRNRASARQPLLAGRAADRELAREHILMLKKYLT